MIAITIFDLLISLCVGLILYRIGKLLIYPDLLLALLKSHPNNESNYRLINESIVQIGRLLSILGILWSLVGIIKFIEINF
jgi:hypothetical protein